MRYILPYLLFLLSLSVSAQLRTSSVGVGDSVALGEVLVTAARYQQNIRNLAAPVEYISQSQLQNIPTGNLSSALSSVPGVQLQSGTFQTIKLTLRGIGSRSQYSTNRTRVYLDDIPLTSGDGTSIFDDIDISFLSGIELTKGSYSAWFGSGMGGSLRFVSSKVSNKAVAADASITAGSYGLIKISGLALSDFKKGKLSAGISHIKGDGYRQNSAFSRSSGLLSGEFSNIKYLGKISYLLMLSDVHAFTPSSVDETTFSTTPSAAATNWLNAKGFKAYKRLIAGVKIDTKIKGALKNSLILTSNTYDQFELRPFNTLDDKSVTWSIQESIRYNNEKVNLALGVESLLEKYDWQTFTNNTTTVLTDARETRRQLNTFASAELLAIRKMRISFAANLNLSEYELDEMKVQNRPTALGSYKAKAIFSPMLGIVYQLSKLSTIYGSAGHGFSNPTVEESLDSEGKMSTKLLPEEGWTIDAGLKLYHPDTRISFQGSLYTIYLNNLLVTKRPTEDFFHGANAGSSVLKGIELKLRHQPTHWINYGLSGSLSENRFQDFSENGVSYAGNQLPGIPQTQVYSDIEIDLPWKFKLNSTFRYNGVHYADDANKIKVNAWKTVDTGIIFETDIFKKLSLSTQLKVNNLLNEHYASMILINAPSFAGRKPRYYYPAMPRNFVFSLRLKWN